jgi:hypothetical protein
MKTFYLYQNFNSGHLGQDLLLKSVKLYFPFLFANRQLDVLFERKYLLNTKFMSCINDWL